MSYLRRRTYARLGREKGPIGPRSHSIEVRNLTFTDDAGDRVLESAYLVAPSGSTVCVVGSTGKDQSALLALMLGLYRPERGAVTLDGQDVASLPPTAVRQSIGLVLNNPCLIEGTIADNIAFGDPDLTRADIVRAAETVGIGQFVNLLSKRYDTVIDIEGVVIGVDRKTGRRRVEAELTPGQQRRLALARAVARNPGVLLLEEPTTGLSMAEERLMISAIDAATRHRTTVMTTHRLSLARRADDVLVIENGRIMPYRGNGPNSDHSKLWDLQVPPVVTPSTDRRDHLRLVSPNDRKLPKPRTGPWGISIGTELAPGYLASGLLGRNTHVETWVAWSVDREEPVRIKIPRSDPVTYAAFDQLFREYKALRTFRHPGLAATYGADLDAEMPYAVFEYLDSTSLSRAAQRIADGMDPLDILYTGFELAGAINYMHLRGFVHLNLRPRHVRTREDTIVITDFTHCQPVGAPLRAQTGPVQTRRLEHRYFAPELAPGAVADPKMDVYALGALIHRATAGSVVTRVTSQGVGLVPFATLTESAPAAMATMVDRMLAHQPEERPTAEEVLSEFRRILPSSLVRPRVSTVTARSPRLRLVGANN